MIECRLEERERRGELRSLHYTQGLVDFASNDYFGFASQSVTGASGSGGSRLLTGHHPFFSTLEEKIARFHGTESCVIFNSGYAANLGLFSALGDAQTTFIYDLNVHASIVDGMRLSRAHCKPFRHNDLSSLERRLKSTKGARYVIINSVYSMKGDKAPLKEIADLCEKYHAEWIVDEAHATGVYRVSEKAFATVHTFSKALGAQGGCVCGSKTLIQFLINFSRPLIYSTALPMSALIAIENAYERVIQEGPEHQRRLQEMIAYFREKASFPTSETAIQPVGSPRVLEMSISLQERGMDVRPILYPTARRGKEFLRVVLHSYNTKDQVDRLLEVVKG
jgi:8-amino-7-oxononanoate synthase